MKDATFHDQPPSWGTFTKRQPPPQEFVIGTDIAFGWPQPCLWTQVVAGKVKTNRGIVTIGAELHGGMLMSGQVDCPGYTRFRALPLQPIWPALLVDAGAYSVTWLMILFAPGAFRRWHRRRHNRCEQCVYSLAGNPGPDGGCPECGWQR